RTYQGGTPKSYRFGSPTRKGRLHKCWNRSFRGNGGEAEAFCRKYGITGPIVLHLGMKAPDKGSICVVEAMKRLWNAGIQAWLVLAGPSLRSFDEYLQHEDSKLSRLLSFGLVSDQEKKDALAAAAVVVQPSRVESL